MELLILSPDEKLLTTMEDELVISAQQREVINNEHTFSFSVLGKQEKAKHVKEGNLVAFEDIEGDFQLYEIILITDTRGDGTEKEALCEHANVELLDEHIEDVRPTNRTAEYALTQALLGTRWQVGIVGELGLGSTNFYREDPKSAIKKIIDVWGGEVRYRLTFENNLITGRYVDLLARRGADRGKTYEHGKDLVEVTRSVDMSTIKTAVRGYGRGEEVGEGFSRRITFADVEWKVANGDPIDKPLGQDWIGDENAREVWGRPEPDGTKRHRFGQFEDSEEEDPEQLLKNAYAYLLSVNQPIANYDGKVVDLFRLKGEEYAHERAVLGDTAAVLDDEITPAIEVKARIIELNRDLLDASNDQAVLGQYLPLYSNQDEEIEKIIAKVKDNSGVWDNPDLTIDPSKYPNIKPSTPVVTANGAFETVQLFWDYAYGEYYTQAFEVYASEVQGFAADPANLIFRGLLNGYNFIGETNKQYYFRVRAINFHGTASDFSDEVSATTARIISTDILFGEEIAAELRLLSESADIIAEGSQGIEILKEGALVGDVFLTDGRTYIAEAAVGTAAIANAAITRLHLQDGIVGTLQIEDAAITTAKVKDLSADKITTGTLHAIDLYSVVIEASELTAVDIYGSTIESREDVNGHENFIRMTNNMLQSHGRYTRTWAGVEETAIINLGIRRGQLWISNEDNGQNLYFTERGLSTSMAGAIDQFTSGTLEFHSQRFNLTSRGVTLHSSFGTVALVSDFSTVVTRSQLTNNIESQTSGIYMRPMREISSGVNEFRFDVKLNASAFDSDGVIGYADFTGANSVGSAIRFAKNGDRIYATNRNGDIGTGDFQARNFYGNDFLGSLKAPTTNAYLMAAYDGEVRVTDKMGYNGGSMNFRPVVALDFRPQSTERIKTNIVSWEDSVLDSIIDSLKLYGYNMKQEVGTPEERIRHGVIIEREVMPSMVVGSSVDLYEYASWAMKGLQEAGAKIRILEAKSPQIDTLINEREKVWFKLDDHEKRIKELEEEIEQLKAA